MRFQVIIEGTHDPSPGSRSQVANLISQRYGLPAHDVFARLQSGRFVAWNGLDHDTAMRCVADLQTLGVHCTVSQEEAAPMVAPVPQRSATVNPRPAIPASAKATIGMAPPVARAAPPAGMQQTPVSGLPGVNSMGMGQPKTVPPTRPIASAMLARPEGGVAAPANAQGTFRSNTPIPGPATDNAKRTMLAFSAPQQQQTQPPSAPMVDPTGTGQITAPPSNGYHVATPAHGTPIPAQHSTNNSDSSLAGAYVKNDFSDLETKLGNSNWQLTSLDGEDGHEQDDNANSRGGTQKPEASKSSSANKFAPPDADEERELEINTEGHQPERAAPPVKKSQVSMKPPAAKKPPVDARFAPPDAEETERELEVDVQRANAHNAPLPSKSKSASNKMPLVAKESIAPPVAFKREAKSANKPAVAPNVLQGSSVHRENPITQPLEWLAVKPRMRFAVGVVLCSLIGFLPAHFFASARESYYGEVSQNLETEYRNANTKEKWAGLDAIRDDAQNLVDARRNNIFVTSSFIWIFAGGILAFLWFRVINWRDLMIAKMNRTPPANPDDGENSEST